MTTITLTNSNSALVVGPTICWLAVKHNKQSRWEQMKSLLYDQTEQKRSLGRSVGDHKFIYGAASTYAHSWSERVRCTILLFSKAGHFCEHMCRLMHIPGFCVPVEHTSQCNLPSSEDCLLRIADRTSICVGVIRKPKLHTWTGR